MIWACLFKKPLVGTSSSSSVSVATNAAGTSGAIFTVSVSPSNYKHNTCHCYFIYISWAWCLAVAFPCFRDCLCIHHQETAFITLTSDDSLWNMGHQFYITKGVCLRRCHCFFILLWSFSRTSSVLCVGSSLLRQADLPSKESYWLCTGLKTEMTKGEWSERKWSWAIFSWGSNQVTPEYVRNVSTWATWLTSCDAISVTSQQIAVCTSIWLSFTFAICIQLQLMFAVNLHYVFQLSWPSSCIPVVHLR
jgi:hypothetical protein